MLSSKVSLGQYIVTSRFGSHTIPIPRHYASGIVELAKTRLISILKRRVRRAPVSRRHCAQPANKYFASQFIVFLT